MKPLADFCVRDSATMQEAIASIQRNESRCVVVIAKGDKVVGVFSEGDVLRAILAGVDVHTPLRTLLRPSFRYLRSADLAAARKLLITGITLIPVIDDEFRLQDVLTLKRVFGEGEA